MSDASRNRHSFDRDHENCVRLLSFCERNSTAVRVMVVVCEDSGETFSWMDIGTLHAGNRKDRKELLTMLGEIEALKKMLMEQLEKVS